MMQALLDVSKAATDLFDLVEAGGVDAPLDNPFAFVPFMRCHEQVRAYYSRRNVHRMLALGVSPADLLRMAGAQS